MRTPDTRESGVSAVRLYVLRATYLLLIVGLGAMIVPTLFSHEPMARGVIPSLLGAVWVLSWVGLRFPLRMLPVLMFEFVWKTVWFVDFGLPQRLSGQMPATFADDFFSIVMGVVLMPLVIPWGYVFRQYLTGRADRWR